MGQILDIRQPYLPGKSGSRFLVLGLLVGASLATLPARGQLRFINEKDGGHVVYGSLTDVNSMPQAMGFMLHTVHTHFEERPSVGKFFKTKGTNSVATFLFPQPRDEFIETGVPGVQAVPQAAVRHGIGRVMMNRDGARWR